MDEFSWILFTCVSKVFEKIIQKLFSSFIDEFISLYFRSYRNNTQFALLLLTEKSKTALDGKGYSGAVLRDLLKSIKTINYELLIAKLYTHGFSKDAL